MNCAKCGEPVMAGFPCINCGTVPVEKVAEPVASGTDGSADGQMANSPLPPMGVTVPIVPTGPVVAPRPAYRRSYLSDGVDWLRELPALAALGIGVAVLAIIVGGIWMLGTQTGKMPAPLPTAPLQPLPASATSTTLPATSVPTTYFPSTGVTSTSIGSPGTGGRVTIPTNPGG